MRRYQEDLQKLFCPDDYHEFALNETIFDNYHKLSWLKKAVFTAEDGSGYIATKTGHTYKLKKIIKKSRKLL